MKLKNGITAVAVLWVFGLIFNLALLVGVIYVAWHLISKWW